MIRNFFCLLLLLFCDFSWAAPVWSQAGKVTYVSLSNTGNHVYFQLSSPKVGGCAGRFYMLNLVDNHGECDIQHVTDS
ncbi:MAG: hypothetical protein AAGB12_08170 [Pseudomonadota bacterium]